MPIDEIAITAVAGETRAAFLERSVLRRLEVGGPNEPVRVGDIFWGRVCKALPGLKAVFVEIGVERPGFLALPEPASAEASGEGRGRPATEGSAVLVQALREPEGEKGAQLTARLSLFGRYLVFLPGQREARVSRRVGDDAERARLAAFVETLPKQAGGWVARVTGAGQTGDRLADDAERLIARWTVINRKRASTRPPARLYQAPNAALAAVADAVGPALSRVVVDDTETLLEIRATLPDLAKRTEAYTGVRPLFAAFGIDEQVDAALAPVVPLPCGGRVVIAETPALVAVDVDTGAAGEGGPEATAVRVNLEAAEIIARQIRLRDLAGHLVIDFVPMRRANHRSRVLAALRRAVADDERRVRLAGFTRLGLVEMTRERRRPSLNVRLNAPCRRCNGSGWVRSPTATAFEALRAVRAEAAAVPGRKLELAASPSIAAALAGPAAEGLAAVEAWLGVSLRLRTEATPGADGFRVAPAADSGETRDGG